LSPSAQAAIASYRAHKATQRANQRQAAVDALIAAEVAHADRMRAGKLKSAIEHADRKAKLAAVQAKADAAAEAAGAKAAPTRTSSPQPLVSFLFALALGLVCVVGFVHVLCCGGHGTG
jgi:hypothetical protein